VPAKRLLALLLTTLAVAVLPRPLPAQGATGGSVVLSQSRDTEHHDDVHTVTATAIGSDGQPVPDGTPVTFSISGPERGIWVGSPVVDAAVTRDGEGAWVLRRDGTVTAQGDARSFGDAAGAGADAAAIAATSTGNGYWIALANGVVKAYGDAADHGSLADRPPPRPIVDLAVRPSGDGYWLVSADGSVYALGGAAPYGSVAGQPAGVPVIAIGATATGNGYWVIDTKGRVSPFGDAPFLGDTNEIKLNQPIVDFAPTADGKGYWFVAADGGIFAFGNSRYLGSTGNKRILGAIVGFVPIPEWGGYVMVGLDGTLHRYTGGLGDTIETGYRIPAKGGRAVLRFSSSIPGTSEVTASVSGGAVSAPVTVRWLADPPASMTLSPAQTSWFTDAQIGISADVRDARGYPVDPTPVDFAATMPGGEQPAPVWVTTGIGGRAA
jgi:hypothetical protein